MKTRFLIAAIMLSCLTVSCDTHYRMISKIANDGSMYREVYTHTDSVCEAKDGTHNPFLFQTSPDWQTVVTDSGIVVDFGGVRKKLNVKAFRQIPSINGQYFSVSKSKDFMHPLAVPQEKLKKSFKWFYTYYTYTATYKELPDKGPVPLDNYLNEAEQTVWFRGDNAFYNNLSGMELNERLDDIEAKFTAWYKRSLYEISCEAIHHFVLTQGDTVYTHRWEELKELGNEKYLKETEELVNGTPETICGFFDEICRTKYFSKLYKTKGEAIDVMCEKKAYMADIFYHNIRFELIMPGHLISSNAGRMQQDTAVWNVDAFRLLAGDYILTAESRTINYWAFGVTLLIMLAIGGILLKSYRHSTYQQ